MTLGAPVIAAGTRFVCSWSGGKDSCLALHRAAAAGARPAFLLSMLCEDGERSRSHGLRVSVLQMQAASLGVPLVTRRASWSSYEETFVDALRELAAAGVAAGVFGDIDLAEHRDWERKVCSAAGIDAVLPLWQTERVALVGEFCDAGYEALIVACNEEKMGSQYLGRRLDPGLSREFERMGIDAAGEEGEYHSVVVDGPPFSWRLQLDSGQTEFHSGYWFLDMVPRG